MQRVYESHVRKFDENKQRLERTAAKLFLTQLLTSERSDCQLVLAHGLHYENLLQNRIDGGVRKRSLVKRLNVFKDVWLTEYVLLNDVKMLPIYIFSFIRYRVV